MNTEENSKSNMPTKYVAHVKRDILMVLSAILILATVTIFVHLYRIGNAGYEDNLKKPTNSVFQYDINGF